MNENKSTKENRFLKVGYLARTQGRTGNRRTVKSPSIKLQGDWLQKAGFLIGEVTRIVVADTYIQIIKEAKND